MIKMIVSDMDGTLLDHGKIHPYTLDNIEKAKKAGVEFVCASGRDYYGITSVLSPLGITCSSILGNGAQYCDEKGNALKSCYLDKNIFPKIIKIFENLDICFMVFTTDGFYSTYDPIYVRDRFAYRGLLRFGDPVENYLPGGPRDDSPCCQIQKIDNVEEFLKKDLEIIKVEAFSPYPEDIAPSLPLLKEIEGISYLSSFIDNVEVTNKFAQKGLILEKVIEDKGLSKEEVIVLGDGMNDLTLFERFPYSFATANGEEEIKALAYKVVGHCKDGGAGEAIAFALENL